MNEDEIIEIVKNEITNTYAEGKAIAFQSLLDLYQKEKEKNKKIVNDFENIKAQSYMLGRTDENEAMKGVIQRHYISKDKIRELLEKYDKNIAWDSADDHYYFTKFIVELLEENNAK